MIVPIKVDAGGWDKIVGVVDERQGHRRHRGERPRRLPDRAGRQRRRLRVGVRGHRRHAALHHPHRGRGDPAHHVPEPGPLAPADRLGGRGADHRAGRHLPAGQERRPGGERAERRHPDRSGVRRRHRLRAAAGRPISRGTAPARGPARGDDDGPAPGRPGDHRERGHRGDRHVLPHPGRAQLDQRARPGRRARRRGRPGRHGHAAAGPAGDLRPLAVLAGAARSSARPSRPRPASGPGSAAGSPAGRGWSGSAPPWPSA